MQKMIDANGRRRDYMEWAKQGQGVLSRSNVSEPKIQARIHEIYPSPEFHALFEEDYQWGLTTLKTSIAQWYQIPHHEDQPRVLLIPGVSAAIHLVCATFIQPGDEVLIEYPNYEPFIDSVEWAKGKITRWPRKGDNFELDLESLASLVTPKTKLIILTNFHNPSGTLSSQEDLKKIEEILQEKGCLETKIVVDEIYRNLALDTDHEEGGKTVAQLGDSWISISGLSKVYGLSRLRAGWILGSTENIFKIWQNYKQIINIGSIDTEAMTDLLFKDLSFFTECSHRAVAKNRDHLREALGGFIEQGNLVGEIPPYACTYFPRLSCLDSLSREKAEEIISQLSKDCGIVPGSFFGEDFYRHIRIGFGSPEKDFLPALQKLKAELSQLFAQ